MILKDSPSGVPGPPPIVFQEANRLAPTHITGRQLSSSHHHQSPSPWRTHLSSMFDVAPNCRCRPPTAGHSPSSTDLLNILFWIWGTDRSHSAWTASNHTWGRPSSHQPPPPAMVVLSSPWLSLVRHLGGSCVQCWGVVCSVGVAGAGTFLVGAGVKM